MKNIKIRQMIIYITYDISATYMTSFVLIVSNDLSTRTRNCH